MLIRRLSFTLVSSKKKPSTQVPGGVSCALRAQLLDDAVDGHKLDHIRIAHQHFIEQHVAGRVIVACR